MAIYTVFDEESDFQVKNKQILEPEGKNKEKLPQKKICWRILTRFWDSRPFQLSTYTVFDEESDFQVKNTQIRHPEAKNKEKRTQKISKIALYSELVSNCPGSFLIVLAVVFGPGSGFGGPGGGFC